MKITGLDKLKKKVGRELAKRERDLRLALGEIGDNHVAEAVARAPVDEGILREAIEREVGGDAVAIRVPLNSPARDYAVAMHEDDYTPGAKSVAAGAKASVYAGRKYMERGRIAAHPLDQEVIRHRLKR